MLFLGLLTSIVGLKLILIQSVCSCVLNLTVFFFFFFFFFFFAVIYVGLQNGLINFMHRTMVYQLGHKYLFIVGIYIIFVPR